MALPQGPEEVAQPAAQPSIAEQVGQALADAGDALLVVERRFADQQSINGLRSLLLEDAGASEAFSSAGR